MISPNKTQHSTRILPASFTAEKKEELFGEIVLAYDLIDKILAAIQREANPARRAELELTTPFITQATNSVNILSGFYTEIVRKNHPVTAEIKDAMDSAFRNFYLALKELIDGMCGEFMPEEGRV
jgi:hypothetical protein